MRTLPLLSLAGLLACANGALADGPPAPPPPPPPVVSAPPIPAPVPVPAPLPTPVAPVAPAVQPTSTATTAPCVCPRIAVIPQWSEWVTRTEHVPGCYQEKRVAVCETTLEPVTKTKTGPNVEYWLEPVYEMKRVPITRRKLTPVYGDVTVPVYATRQVPVKVPCWNTCSNEELMSTLFHRQDKVQVGVCREHRLLGYKEESVPCGYQNERCQVGWAKRERVCGTRCEEHCVGTEPVTRRVGWRNEVVQTRKESTKTVYDIRAHPRTCVTVVPDGAPRPAPLPGSVLTMSESEYAAAIQAASRAYQPGAAPGLPGTTPPPAPAPAPVLAPPPAPQQAPIIPGATLPTPAVR